MTPSGTILGSDVDTHELFAIDQAGRRTVILRDERLQWVDAMWIDADFNLWMPAAQLDRISLFNDGKPKLRLPIAVYRIPLSSLHGMDDR